MTTASANHPPLTRREFGYYIFGAALVLLLGVVVGMVLWIALPRPTLFDLGALNSFRTDGPTRRFATLPDGQALPLWVVRDKETWLILHGRMKITRNWNCEYKWVPTNNRFEDPCSGFKWALTGELLTYFENPPKQWLTGLRDLDQYKATVRDGHLFVNLNKFIPGVASTEPPPQVECLAHTFTTGRMVRQCALRATPAP